MLSRIRTRLTFANVVSLLALFVALGGSVYAAGKLNGTKIKRASLPGNRIVPNSVKGKQVRESKLGQVPSAGVANQAFSAFNTGNVDFAADYDATPIGTLDVPKAGNYVIDAKLEAEDTSASNLTSGECQLTAEGDVDKALFDALGNGTDDTEDVSLQVAHTFTGPGSVVLDCKAGVGITGTAFNTRITAIQVKSLTNTPF